MLNMPNSLHVFPTFHASQLKLFMENNPVLFPSCKHPWPGPVVTTEGIEEYVINEIIDNQQRECSWSYLVRWAGYGAEDPWLPGMKLADCKALD
jgi:hypothetical protein